MNVYKFKHKTFVGSSKPYIKNNTVTYDPIMDWKEKELYEIIGGNSSDMTVTGKILTEHNALFELYPTHILDYDEKTVEFLENVTTSLKDLVNKITTFFNVPPEKLIESILNNNGIKLLS